MQWARRSVLGALAVLAAGAGGAAKADSIESLMPSSVLANDFPQEIALVAVAEASLRRIALPPGTRLGLVFLALRPGVSQVLRLWHVDVPTHLRVTALDAHPGVQGAMRQVLLFTSVALHGGRRVGHEAVLGLAPDAQWAGVYLLVECSGLRARDVADRALWMQLLSDTDGPESFDTWARAGDVPDSPLQAQARVLQGLPVAMPALRARTQWLR
jgi:hypothetical protein